MENPNDIFKQEKPACAHQDLPLFRFPAAPAVNRTPFAYRRLSGKEKKAEAGNLRKLVQGNPFVRPWQGAAFVRRSIFLALALASAWFAGITVTTIFSGNGITGIESLIIADFILLFSWISVNFWIALLGFFTLIRRRDPLNVTNCLARGCSTVSAATRIAVVMPLYNEDVARAFNMVRVIYESVKGTGKLNHFDFYILSDTTDPDIWVAEEAAWIELCSNLDAPGRLFYRHRNLRIGKKSGNIADFLRRWGKNYDHMVVLDADSFMSGSLLVKLVQIMECRPDIGILQSTPRMLNGKSLLARIQQFAANAYGPLFLAGLHFWQLGDAEFWGHNAIIRVKPFMKFCGLPKAPGKGPFSGEILSHDFIEAALMRRAGYGVWLTYDLDDSYEQPPANIRTELERDKRWCRGNLQHLRFIFMGGISFGHRLLFLNGNMFYFSSLFWLLLIILTTINTLSAIVHGVNFFPQGMVLFPDWPVQHRALSLNLLISTAVFLFGPKILSITAVMLRSKQDFGGGLKLILNSLIETLSSVFLAPTRMLFHSFFVIRSLFGGPLSWGRRGQRSEEGLSLGQAFKMLWPGTILAFGWAFLFYYFDTSLFWWLSPVFLPLIFSIPLTMAISSPRVGSLLKKHGIMLIPEEIRPPQGMALHQNYLSVGVPRPADFISAAVDHRVNDLHRLLLRGERNVPPADREKRRKIESKALLRGPESLKASEKRELLRDAASIERLHRSIWKEPEDAFSRAWKEDAFLPAAEIKTGGRKFEH